MKIIQSFGGGLFLLIGIFAFNRFIQTAETWSEGIPVIALLAFGVLLLRNALTSKR